MQSVRTFLPRKNSQFTDAIGFRAMLLSPMDRSKILENRDLKFGSVAHAVAMICSVCRIDSVRKRGEWSQIRILLSKSPRLLISANDSIKKRLKKLSLTYKRRGKRKYKNVEGDRIYETCGYILAVFFLSRLNY